MRNDFTQVSIRARPIDRAMRTPTAKGASEIEFQSAPDQLIGRCEISRGNFPRNHVVSIRARPIDRAMPGLGSPEPVGMEVSIRARPIDRAMRLFRDYAEAMKGFNPRPTN